jgi:hypothetical protein
VKECRKGAWVTLTEVDANVADVWADADVGVKKVAAAVAAEAEVEVGLAEVEVGLAEVEVEAEMAEAEVQFWDSWKSSTTSNLSISHSTFSAAKRVLLPPLVYICICNSIYMYM